MRTIISSALVTLSAALLLGCGGGGGDETTNPNPNPNPNPAGATMSAQELQLAMDTLTQMNVHRAAQVPPLPAYTWHQVAADVGFAHCLQMETNDFFAHVDPGTMFDPSQRGQNAGMMHDPMGAMGAGGAPFIGENLYGSTGAVPTGQSAITSWSTSPGHNTQMVAPQPVAGAQTMPAWTHCGIGVRYDGNQYWVTAMFLRNPN